MKKHRVFWVLGILLLAGGGGAAALFLANRREVTTTSRAAYEAFEEALLNQKRFYTKEARVGFAKALELDPNFAMAILRLSDLSSDHEQSVTLVRRAARQRDRVSERERYWIDIAVANVDGKPEQALKLAGELHERYPDDYLGVEYLARAALLKGDTDRGIKIYEELLAVDPNNADAYNQIGYYHGYRGEYQKAIDSLTRYQFIAPDTANPFDSLAENQANSGHYNEAIENLNRALAIKSDFYPAYWHLGVTYEGMGDYAKAVESYEKAADLADSDGMRRGYLTMALRAALIGQDRAALHTAMERLQRIPPDQKEFAHIAPAFFAAVGDLADGRPAEAERRLREIRPVLEARFDQNSKAGKMLPGYKAHYPEWNFLMACALEKQGKSDEALKLYEANAAPPNPFYNFDDRRWIMEARAKVAELVARKGDLDRAEKLIAENRKWNPSWAPCRPSEAVVAELRRTKVLAASK